MHLNQTNIVHKIMCTFRKCHQKNKSNSYIGYTTTKLSCGLTYYLSENSAKKKYFIINHSNSTNQLTSSM